MMRGKRWRWCERAVSVVEVDGENGAGGRPHAEVIFCSQS